MIDKCVSDLSEKNFMPLKRVNYEAEVEKILTWFRFSYRGFYLKLLSFLVVGE
jgi:hypothetical protein